MSPKREKDARVKLKEQKKEARAHRRHVRFVRFIHPLITPIIKRKFNYTYDDCSNIDGPYLVLCNHNLNIDPIFLNIATKNQVYFVASEHLTRAGFATKLLNYFFRPIFHKKGTTGVKTLSEMLKALKKGYNVAMFPEGNRSFNGLTGGFSDAIAKVAKKCGAKVITYKIEGGYLTQPRWSVTLRKGKLHGKLVHVYTPEELGGMTEEEIYESLQKDLFEDAYATQAKEQVLFKGKDLALGMEATVFMCPKCKAVGSLKTEDNRVECTCCHAKAVYSELGNVDFEDNTSYTLTQLDTLQKDGLRELCEKAKDEDVLFEDMVTLYEIGEDHQQKSVKETKLTAFKDHVFIEGRNLYPKDFVGMGLVLRNTIETYLNEDKTQYEIKGPQSFSALKYLYLYKLNGGK